ncbi:TauD/TfdA family dioxygenase [Paenibacillus polymyxa]|uniref:TauD/TfdA family dioxygenase n=1 Tax=Paenibacillus polymyxa TaxID=1406 RepID=UPI002AB4405C|nr:TauD/TfdA family dioxygenase [Paenibacillus polymyxa]MDY7989862.1 TauD/TfdA family dioxygenase [Paenibacillus polymyxa]MDY8116779.1 TauD/TfdA family dioxygenase [Paenibacillus polymyxa]
MLSNLNSELINEFDRALFILNTKINPNNPQIEDINIVENIISNSKVLQKFKQHLLEQLYDGEGYFYCDLNSITKAVDEAKLINFLILCCVGQPIWLFKDAPLWFELQVKPEVDPIRTHGTGKNPLHTDLLVFEYLPDVISFHCIRKDPQGGGDTLLCDMTKILNFLSVEEIDLLSLNIYKYWKDEGIDVLGNSMSSFSIIKDRIIRYTSKMKKHLYAHSADVLTHEGLSYVEKLIALFEKLDLLIDNNMEEIKLEAGHLMLFNQLRFTHGRGELGSNQQDISKVERRLISQSYVHRKAVFL